MAVAGFCGKHVAVAYHMAYHKSSFVYSAHVLVIMNAEHISTRLSMRDLFSAYMYIHMYMCTSNVRMYMSVTFQE